MTSKDLHELPVPAPMLAEHRRMGGRWIRRWVGPAEGGILRVFCGCEPIYSLGAHGLHLSVSHARTDEVGEVADRLPTEAEEAAALALFPGHQWERETGETAIHFWEVQT